MLAYITGTVDQELLLPDEFFDHTTKHNRDSAVPALADGAGGAVVK
jgi:hypothetical protein